MRQRTLMLTAALCALSAGDRLGASPLSFRNVEFYADSTLTNGSRNGGSFFKGAGTGARVSMTGASAIGTVSFTPDGMPELSRWGISGRIRRADLLLGTLNFSSARSRLSSPQLTVPSALHQTTVLAPGISPRLPGFTSSRKSPAAAVSFGGIQGAWVFGSEALISASKELRIPLTSSAQVSLCAGLFNLKGSAGSSWFTGRTWYAEQTCLAGTADFSFTTAHIVSSTAVALHQNPRGAPSLWVRTHESLTAGPFTLGAAFFAATPGLVTVSSTENYTRLQAQLNPQVSFRLAGYSAAAGILAHADFYEGKERGEEPYVRYTLKADMRLINQVSSLHANSTVRYSGLTEKFEWSSKVQGSVRLRNTSQNSSLTVKSADGSRTYTVSQKSTFTGGKAARFLKSASVSADFLDDEESGFFKVKSVTGSITARSGGKKIKWSAKATLSLTF